VSAETLAEKKRVGSIVKRRKDGADVSSTRKVWLSKVEIERPLIGWAESGFKRFKKVKESLPEMKS
jgi:hypothetical protein